MVEDRELILTRDGAQLFAGAVDPAWLAAIGRVIEFQESAAGTRLHDTPGLSELLTFPGPIATLAQHFLGQAAKPVRALLLDKNAHTNWSLGWHQDRVIAVRERKEVPGYGPWTIKSGLHHVSPPFALLERMLTLRIHLDPVDAGNGPLRIAPGSHRLGRIAEDDIDDVVARCGIRTSEATRGDIWAYATPILHASAKAVIPTRRRVLQVDYSADALDGGLEWLGV